MRVSEVGTGGEYASWVRVEDGYACQISVRSNVSVRRLCVWILAVVVNLPFVDEEVELAKLRTSGEQAAGRCM
jgi:hypothetical protein